MIIPRTTLVPLLVVCLLAGLLGPAVRAEGEEGKAKPPPVQKWWEIPKIRGPAEESPGPSGLARWIPQIFAPPEPGLPQANIFVRTWGWLKGLFHPKPPAHLPPGWKRSLEDPVEVEVTPTPTPPIPGGVAHFDPATGFLTVTGVSVTVTKPEPARPASHERASKIARELIVSEVASFPTNRGVALGEVLTSEDVDAMRAQMEEIFASRQPDGTWVATVRVNLRSFPIIHKYSPGVFSAKQPWNRTLTKVTF